MSDSQHLAGGDQYVYIGSFVCTMVCSTTNAGDVYWSSNYGWRVHAGITQQLARLSLFGGTVNDKQSGDYQTRTSATNLWWVGTQTLQVNWTAPDNCPTAYKDLRLSGEFGYPNGNAHFMKSSASTLMMWHGGGLDSTNYGGSTKKDNRLSQTKKERDPPGSLPEVSVLG